MSEEKSPASDHEKFYQLMLNFESRLSHISRLSPNNNMACSVEERIHKVQNPNIIVALNNVNAETTRLLKLESLLNEIQKKAYKVAVNCIEKETGPQMIMFLTGGSGTGKSLLLQAISKKIVISRGKTVGLFGSVLITAPTSACAFDIGGHSWRAALGVKSPRPRDLTAIETGKLREKAAGLHLFVLDMMHCVSSSDLWLISRRLCDATGVYTKPFGGLHTILCGDFYQFRPISGISIAMDAVPNTVARVGELEGRDLFRDSLTHYVILSENTRVIGSMGPLSTLVRFATQARLGLICPAVLSEINQRVANTLEQAMAIAHPQAVWISDTNRRAKLINNEFLLKLVSEGGTITRLIADHKPARGDLSRPDLATRVRLYEVEGEPRCLPVCLELCEGSRVALTVDLFPTIGLFYGAMGTVVGYVYRNKLKPGDSRAQPTGPLALLEDEERELPIVMVQFDKLNRNFQISCTGEMPRLVPILPVADRIMISVGGRRYKRYQIPLRPAHSCPCYTTAGISPSEGIVIAGPKALPGFAAEYVRVSRATSMDKLLLLQPLRTAHFTGYPDFRVAIHNEYARLDNQFSQETFVLHN